ADQVLLGRKVVVDGLLGDFGLAGHVTDGDVPIAALGNQTRGGFGDLLTRPGLFELTQSATGHLSQPSGKRPLNGVCSKDIVDTSNEFRPAPTRAFRQRPSRPKGRDPMILITTAGKVGAEAARLLAQREEPVRILVRDPKKAVALTK